MFIGQLDPDGNYRSANSYAGNGSSFESARSIHYNNDLLYAIIRSNSDTLVLGDSTYVSSNSADYIVFGVVGCLPISIDQVSLSDTLVMCYGDSTETIEILASDGFGAPWRYSIDNAETPSSDSSIFYNVPAGNYQIVVFDSAGCSLVLDSSLTISQPERLRLLLQTVKNPWEINIAHDGYIKVEAQEAQGTIPTCCSLVI